MEDRGHEYADAAVAAFQAEVRETYREAERGAKEALDGFLRRFEARDAAMRERLEAGEIDEGEYRDWRRRTMLVGERYQSVLDQMAAALSNANRIALDVLAGKLPDVAAENANWAAYQVEGASEGASFALQDAGTVAHMLSEGEGMLPQPSLNVGKDMAWNRRHMAAAVVQGVLLGEPIPKIAKRLEQATGMARAAATRTARTAVTGAECAGRVLTYRRSEGMGIALRQEWVATLDGRTRHSHRRLDGETVEVGGTFSNGCRYPGDPRGSHAETMNCRCTLVAAVEGAETSDARRRSRLPGGMTYEEWKRGKAPGAKMSGASMGALSDRNDPDGTRRDAHAVSYYAEVRKRDMGNEVSAVSRNSGIDKSLVKKAMRHLFIDEHDLDRGRGRFDEDYEIAQSWQRLRSGKGIMPHDLTLILHESHEYDLMKQGMGYDEAHAATNLLYNYQKQVDEYLEKGGS